MSENLIISADWEPLDRGTPEERNCFAALGIRVNAHCLTEGRDTLANRLREAPLLSAYHLAEWLAWNWWRLRWEPKSQAKEWALSHRLSTIGGGYIWPNISIFSDGQRITFNSKSVNERAETPFRYISNLATVISATEFEAGIDDFIDQVLQRLQAMQVGVTNLENIWKGVQEERHTPELAVRRKLEALLGQDPDESDENVLQQLMTDTKRLGIGPVEELAADQGHGLHRQVATAEELGDIANQFGASASIRDMVCLGRHDGQHFSQAPAWHVGSKVAQALREQEQLGDGPISNEKLAAMLGVDQSILVQTPTTSVVRAISFALETGAGQSRIVLRSKWETGKRFDLARLLGDHLINTTGDALLPATRAYTYRQKAQRSFAAELLSPFKLIDDMLDGDFSMENQQDVAAHFNVSELTIRTLLVNHGRIEREELDGEFLVTA